jgi:hypothetical protein
MGIDAGKVPVLLFTDHHDLRKFIKQGGLVSHHSEEHVAIRSAPARVTCCVSCSLHYMHCTYMCMHMKCQRMCDRSGNRTAVYPP